MRFAYRAGAFLVLVALLVAGCGSDEPASQTGDAAELPVVVATTNILGDVLDNVAGGQFEVVTIMPVGSDPHDFQPSAQDVAAIEKASAIIANGAAFEGGLLDAVNAAGENGTPVFKAITAVTPLVYSEHDDHDEHGDEDHDDDHGDDDHDDDHGDEDHDDDHGDEDHDDDHGDEDHGDDHDDHGHEEGGSDPHFFTDPVRMAIAVDEIAAFLVENIDGVDAAELQSDADAYVSVLTVLHEEVEEVLAPIADADRILVTNHEVFAYFADRYDFEVIGTVVPSGSGSDGVSGRRLAELAELLKSKGVSAVFSDTSSSDELAQTLASEVGEVTVVDLYTESLGPADSDGSTYVDMIRTNAGRIADALSS